VKRRPGLALLAAALGFAMCGLTEPPPPTSPPSAPPAKAPAPDADVRFEAVDVFVDAGESPLSAYQFDLATPAREGWQASIVGVEGGEHPAFRKAPYYDPAALHAGRIIIAAYSVDEALPTGRTRVARLHMELRRVAGAPAAEAFDMRPPPAAPASSKQPGTVLPTAPPPPAALPAVESGPTAKKVPGRPGAPPAQSSPPTPNPATTGAPAPAPAAAPASAPQAEKNKDAAPLLGGYTIALTTAATTGGATARATVSLARAAQAPAPTPTPAPAPIPTPGGTP